MGILTAVLFATALTTHLQAQTPPKLKSVTPLDGATGVSVSTPLVFEFDQVMNITFPIIPTVPGFLVGNFQTDPSTPGQQMTGDWSEDGRTLTLTPQLPVPLNITLSWTLNPPGGQSIFQIKSAAGISLATVSGTYSTGQTVQPPTLSSVTPLANATAVPVNTTVIFKFNQPMKKQTAPGGNPPTIPGAVSWTGVEAAKFTYTWSADGRQLACDYSGGFPLSTSVGWVLNPTAAPTQLESLTGQVLPADTFSGNFNTAATIPCDPDPLPDTWGNYTLFKISTYDQTSSADPTPNSDGLPFLFSTFVSSPTLGPVVTAASITRPNGTQTNLSSFGVFQFSQSFNTQAALDAAYPAGNYSLRFSQTGLPERVISINVPAEVPPIPKISNFASTQAWNAAQDFTLQWNVFTGAADQDYLSLFLSDSEGEVIFQAPDACVPRELPVSATSIVIPASTLAPNQTYTGQIIFGNTFYSSTNTVPQMSGFGSVQRITVFTLQTADVGGPVEPATLSAVQLLPNGNLRFALSGEVGHRYGIQRATALNASTWPEVGAVTLDSTGSGTFEDTQAPTVLPFFYRAVAK